MKARQPRRAALALCALLCAAAAAQFALGGPAAGALGLAAAAAAAFALARFGGGPQADAAPEPARPGEARRDEEDIEQALRAAFELVGDGVLALGPGDQVVWANAAALRMFGYAESELAGRGLADLLPERAAGAPAAQRQARRKDGARFPVDLALAEPEPGARRLRFARLRDLSQPGAADEVLVESQKNQMTSQLASGVAHDFNNQLTVILAYAGLLDDALAGRDEKLRRMAESIRAAARNAAELTRQLLAFGRRQPMGPAAVDLAPLLKSLQRMLRSALGERVELVLRLAGQPAVVFVDRAELEAAVLGLAMDARDAMPGGGRMEISTSLERGEDGERRVVLALRAEAAGAGELTAGVGSGPGLDAALRLARRAGGAARVESEPAGGARAALILPLMAAPPLSETGAAHEVGESAVGETILVVEDEPLVRDFVTAQLRRLGYAVLEAPDGPSALAEIERGGRIDLVFSDLVMPGGLSGFALAEAARRRRPGLKFLFTTGYSEEEADAKGASPAEPDILRKPYELKELARRIRAALAQGRT